MNIQLIVNKIYRKDLLFVPFLFSSIVVNSQVFNASTDTLKKHVYYLASEELKGRNTGTEGQKMAANYIMQSFSGYGLSALPENGYFHYYHLKKKHKNSITLKSDGNVIFWPWHFFYTASNNHADTLVSELVFCGYGTKQEVENLDTQNKTIAIVAHCPKDAYLKIKEIRNNFGNKNFMVLFPEKNKDIEKAWATDYELAYYTLPGEFDKCNMNKIEEEWASPLPDDSLRIYYCFPNVMRKVFGRNDKELEDLAKQNIELNYSVLDTLKQFELTAMVTYADSIEEIKVENVGGIIYGTDTTQTIVVTAHYDHIGEDMGKINYGADDNASGVSVVMEAARQLSRVFNDSIKPKRNILFLAFSGEEIGLLGSEAYVKNPVFEINKTVLNINLDMVGRWDERHEENKNFVYLLTAGANSKEYFKLGKKRIKNPVNFEVSNKPGAKEKLIFKYGSDHYSFYKKDVPIAVFFTGLHDDYHTPKDTPDKINYTNLTNISNLVSSYIYIIATDTVTYPLR